MKKRYWLLILLLGIAALGWWLTARYRGEAIFAMERRFLQPRQEVVPKGLPDLKARSCGACHQAIYREWRVSMHGRAWRDPFFQSFWSSDGQPMVCLACHTPLAQQRRELPIGYPERGEYTLAQLFTRENPDYNRELQQEGVTCAVCHVRSGMILSPYPQKSAFSPHPVSYSAAFTSVSLCKQCHEVKGTSFQFYRQGMCGSVNDFRNSPYRKEGYICQSCHMPAVTRPLMPGLPARRGRRHLWIGGHSPAMVRQALAVTVTTGNDSAQLYLENRHAGHPVPTGDPDRKIVMRAGWMDAKGVTRFVAHWQINRLILWWPLIVELEDNRLTPFESRRYQWSFPEEATAAIVEIRYQILSGRHVRILQEDHQLPLDSRKDYPLFSFVVPRHQQRTWSSSATTPPFYGAAVTYWLQEPGLIRTGGSR